MKRFPSPGALTGGLLTLALLPVSWPSGALAQEVEACTEEATDLIAGQTTVVGDVNVCNDDTTLTVTYEPSSPWCLVSTALHVAASEDDIPQTKNGNPKPGQFADGDDYDPCVDTDTFEILLEDIGVSPGVTVVVAANARVLNMETGAEEGAWGDGTRFVEPGNWAMYFTYTVEEPFKCGGEESKCVFVTSRSFTGDLVGEAQTLTGEPASDGLDAGDRICQFHADEANLEGTYKAWLSTSGEGNSAADRLDHAAVPYRLVNGTPVANNFEALTTCVAGECLSNPISVTEKGGEPELFSTWTATDTNGDWFGGLLTCLGWSSDDVADIGNTGDWEAVSLHWTDGGATRCDSPSPALYCFQQ